MHLIKKISRVIFLVTLLASTTFGQTAKVLETAKDYELRADNAYSRGEVADAFSYYNYALWELKKKYKGDEVLTEEYLKCLIKVSSLAYELEQMDDAKNHLIEAKTVAEEAYHKHDPKLALVYKHVGDMYLEEDDCNTALNFYELSFKIYHKFGHEYPKEIAAVLYKKAYILNHYKHEMDKALKECSKAIDYGVEASRNNPDLGDYFSECGLIEFVQGNYKDSYNYFLNALQIKEKHFDHESATVGKAYEEFGAVNWELHRFDSAMYYYEQARDIYDHVYTGVHSHVEAVEYNSHELVYVEVDKDSTEHHDCMKKDLDIDNITLKNRNRKVARTYAHVAESYEHLNNYKLAAQSYNKAIDIYDEVFPGGNIEVADTYEKLGEVYKLDNNIEDAKKAYNKCADIREEKLGVDHDLTQKAKKNATMSIPRNNY